VTPGELRHRIVIEQPTLLQPNAIGDVLKPLWKAYATIWSCIQPLSGRELQVAKSFADTVSHRIVIRWYPEIETTYRLDSKGKIFNINAIIHADEKGNFPYQERWLSIYCTEQADYVIPAAPVLESLAGGAGTTDLSWSSGSGITNYQIFRSEVSGEEYGEVATVAGTVNSYHDTGLAASTYYYVVTAKNSYGQSVASNELSVVVT
jgi:SPP1 family predicted phage head-tail adaptor